ncbi:MAG: hypothetical protein M1819_002585 [Sarea resinae]|nr:MAG: hypothetical protein M1819_002585 [Sarea resinae]
MWKPSAEQQHVDIGSLAQENPYENGTLQASFITSRGYEAEPSCLVDRAYMDQAQVRQWASHNGFGVSHLPGNGPSMCDFREGLTLDELHASNTEMQDGSSISFASNASSASIPASSGSPGFTEKSVCFSDNGDYLFGQDCANSDDPVVVGYRYGSVPSSHSVSDSIEAMDSSSLWDTNESFSTAFDFTTFGPDKYLYESDLTSRSNTSLPGYWESPSGHESVGPLSSTSECPSATSLQSLARRKHSPRTTSGFSSATAESSATSYNTQSSFSALLPSSRRSSITQAGEGTLHTNPRESPSVANFPDLTMKEASKVTPSSLPSNRAGSFTSAKMNGPARRRQRAGGTSPVAELAGPDDVSILSTSSATVVARSGDEMEIGPARDHPLYQATLHEDGLYHCAYEGREGCMHRPTKLKCNYDKYVDSHLRPYRCKIATCVEARFSSTACLLRHEREAHGMHGHGAKPHLCPYENCERSILGNGFPRRWNLYDHMKRVHDYKGPPSSADSTSPGPSVPATVPELRHSRTRKRKSPGVGMAQQGKRHKSHSSDRSSGRASLLHEKTSPIARPTQIQDLEKQWTDCFTNLQDCLRHIQDPRDAPSHEELCAKTQSLHEIASTIRRLSPEQASFQEKQYERG